MPGEAFLNAIFEPIFSNIIDKREQLVEIELGQKVQELSKEGQLSFKNLANTHRKKFEESLFMRSDLANLINNYFTS